MEGSPEAVFPRNVGLMFFNEEPHHFFPQAQIDVVYFPYEALEEALANAVYHRGYDEREPIEVRINPEEIVIVNYPGSDRSVRLDQLRKGKAVSRRYRNRRIGDFLKELEITEGRSTGIPKILRVMKNNGSPPPGFEFDEDHSYFLVRLPVHPKEKSAPGQRESDPQVTGEVTGFSKFSERVPFAGWRLKKR